MHRPHIPTTGGISDVMSKEYTKVRATIEIVRVVLSILLFGKRIIRKMDVSVSV